MLAEPGILEVQGIDLSRDQIELARKNAAREKLDAVCRYELGDLRRFRANPAGGRPCVLIHALLHHLTWQEIRSLLDQVVRQGAGTRVFIYEPVHPEARPLRPRALAPLWRWLGRSAAALPEALAWLASREWRSSFDHDLWARVEAMCDHSRQQGWVFSPKETVFQERELTDLLESYFEVREVRVCNYLSYLTGLTATLHRGPGARRRFVQGVIPVAHAIDRALSATSLLGHVARDQVFLGVFCTVR